MTVASNTLYWPPVRIADCCDDKDDDEEDADDVAGGADPSEDLPKNLEMNSNSLIADDFMDYQEKMHRTCDYGYTYLEYELISPIGFANGWN